MACKEYWIHLQANCTVQGTRANSFLKWELNWIIFFMPSCRAPHPGVHCGLIAVDYVFSFSNKLVDSQSKQSSFVMELLGVFLCIAVNKFWFLVADAILLIN